MVNRLTVITVVLAVVSFNNISAQDELQKYVEKVAEENIEGYFKPFVTAFGTAINSGLYHTAETHKTGGFDLTIKGVAVLISDEAKTFIASDDQPWSTIFGPERENSPPSMDLKLVIMAVPQVSFGIGNDLEALLRFLKFDLGDFGDVSL